MFCFEMERCFPVESIGLTISNRIVWVSQQELFSETVMSSTYNIKVTTPFWYYKTNTLSLKLL